MEADDGINLRVASFSCYLDVANERLIHKVAPQENPISTPHNIKFSHSKDILDYPTTNQSFSFYNSVIDKNFVFEVPGSIRHRSTGFTFSRETPRDGEISVFGADRYFNKKLEYCRKVEAKHKKNNELPVILSDLGSDIQTKTPSLSSKTSSQRPLLPDPRRTVPQRSRRRFFKGFVCQGPCFNKNSVDADETVAKNRSMSLQSDLIPLSIPPETRKCVPSKQNIIENSNSNSNEPRVSLEVFGSKTCSKGDIQKKMERELSMLTWDAIPIKSQRSSTSTTCDDLASEASSDLFEIEHISGSLHPFSSSELLAKDISTCTSPIASNYAPSEVSIQWSVVTASTAGYLDYNDEASVSVAGEVVTRKNGDRRSSRTVNGVDKEGKKGRAGGILGCNGYQAVAVAENACHK